MAEHISNPEAPRIQQGVLHVDHPQLVEGIRQMAKNGVDKSKAIKLSGAPYEVVDRLYKQVKEEK